MILLPECEIERHICYHIGFKDRDINKSNGKAGVITNLEKLNVDVRAIGIVDQDPNAIQHNSYKNFVQIGSSHSLRLLRKKQTNHYLIEFENEFEPWILKIRQKAKISPTGYKVELTILHEINAQVNIPKNYLNFYWKILQVYPGPLNMIKNWIAKYGKE